MYVIEKNGLKSGIEINDRVKSLHYNALETTFTEFIRYYKIYNI